MFSSLKGHLIYLRSMYIEFIRRVLKFQLGTTTNKMTVCNAHSTVVTFTKGGI